MRHLIVAFAFLSLLIIYPQPAAAQTDCPGALENRVDAANDDEICVYDVSVMADPMRESVWPPP